MKLSGIVGHARIRQALVTAHATDTVHHAYLLAGPEGVGKRRVALGFVGLVNCIGDAPVDAAGRRTDACGTCRSCRRVEAVLAEQGDERVEPPDLLRLEPAPGERAIKIEQVREVLRIVPFPPIEAAYRFVLVDPAEAMTVPAANALLKTLEEPPSRTRFLLVTSRPDALLTTIRSRCQRLVFTRLADADVAAVLAARHGVEAGEAARVAALADGSLGVALALLDDPVLATRDDLVRRLVSIPPGQAAAAFALGAELGASKDSLRTVLEILRRLYRDALLLRAGADPIGGLASPHLREEVLEPLAARLGTAALLHRLELVAETERGILQRNLNPRAAMERLVLALTAPAGGEGAEPGALGG